MQVVTRSFVFPVLNMGTGFLLFKKIRKHACVLTVFSGSPRWHVTCEESRVDGVTSFSYHRAVFPSCNYQLAKG